MPLVQLSLTTDARSCDALETACFSAGALSVTLLDAADTPILEPRPGETPLWPAVRLVVQFAEGPAMPAVVEAIRALAGTAVTVEKVAGREWEREWLKDVRPMRFGTRLWVCSREQTPPDGKAVVVVWLCPGLAFGTGTHPTTAMCLQWLDATELHSLDVLDYGCGSGILAIAALKLGARSAAALDIDPQALAATLSNARINEVGERLLVIPVSEAPPLVDVVVANILAQPLTALAPTFGSLVRRGGRLVVSGILKNQAQAVALACEPWFDMHEFAAREDWVCLEGGRR